MLYRILTSEFSEAPAPETYAVGMDRVTLVAEYLARALQARLDARSSSVRTEAAGAGAPSGHTHGPARETAGHLTEAEAGLGIAPSS